MPTLVHTWPPRKQPCVRRAFDNPESNLAFPGRLGDQQRCFLAWQPRKQPCVPGPLGKVFALTPASLLPSYANRQQRCCLFGNLGSNLAFLGWVPKAANVSGQGRKFLPLGPTAGFATGVSMLRNLQKGDARQQCAERVTRSSISSTRAPTANQKEHAKVQRWSLRALSRCNVRRCSLHCAFLLRSAPSCSARPLFSAFFALSLLS